MLGKLGLLAGIGAMLGILVGCDTKTPNCSGEETQALVHQIVQKELVKAYPNVPQDKLNSLQISLNAIRTQSHNAERDSYSCAANLTFSRFGQNNSTPITYTIEKVDNGQHFYVQVYGL
ncbi:hypothetical protein [Klebsiella sp. BIGb0407]|uniref:hypothetical protein n=1 Tax=Klebsiella sp. BIGb0407 TaxID=2940603 RepID=UPI002169ADD0|nr:hypothetical protein [Klebsiella sp. BIGb0407]MCS3434039.1 hypothetical protein [Klebsiella sp. BIGb0407]